MFFFLKKEKEEKRVCRIFKLQRFPLGLWAVLLGVACALHKQQPRNSEVKKQQKTGCYAATSRASGPHLPFSGCPASGCSLAAVLGKRRQSSPMSCELPQEHPRSVQRCCAVTGRARSDGERPPPAGLVCLLRGTHGVSVTL